MLALRNKICELALKMNVIDQIELNPFIIQQSRYFTHATHGAVGTERPAPAVPERAFPTIAPRPPEPLTKTMESSSVLSTEVSVSRPVASPERSDSSPERSLGKSPDRNEDIAPAVAITGKLFLFFFFFFFWKILRNFFLDMRPALNPKNDTVFNAVIQPPLTLYLHTVSSPVSESRDTPNKPQKEKEPKSETLSGSELEGPNKRQKIAEDIANSSPIETHDGSSDEEPQYIIKLKER